MSRFGPAIFLKHKHFGATLLTANASARVAELADARDLGSREETRGGSTPPSRTKP